jgi:hypothetical protein
LVEAKRLWYISAMRADDILDDLRSGGKLVPKGTFTLNRGKAPARADGSRRLAESSDGPTFALAKVDLTP